MAILKVCCSTTMAVSCRKAAAAAAERHVDVALVMCINEASLSAAAD